MDRKQATEQLLETRFLSGCITQLVLPV